MIAEAWKEVTASTIMNCFRSAGWIQSTTAASPVVPSPIAAHIGSDKTVEEESKDEATIIQDIKRGLQTIMNKEHVEVLVEYPYEDGLAVEPFRARQASLIRDQLESPKAIKIDTAEPKVPLNTNKHSFSSPDIPSACRVVRQHMVEWPDKEQRMVTLKVLAELEAKHKEAIRPHLKQQQLPFKPLKDAKP